MRVHAFVCVLTCVVSCLFIRFCMYFRALFMHVHAFGMRFAYIFMCFACMFMRCCMHVHALCMHVHALFVSFSCILRTFRLRYAWLSFDCAQTSQCVAMLLHYFYVFFYLLYAWYSLLFTSFTWYFIAYACFCHVIHWLCYLNAAAITLGNVRVCIHVFLIPLEFCWVWLPFYTVSRALIYCLTCISIHIALCLSHLNMLPPTASRRWGVREYPVSVSQLTMYTCLLIYTPLIKPYDH